jgi:RNA polymerase sigma-70 factor (ECF subfamily)
MGPRNEAATSAPPILPRVALGDPLAVRACINRYERLVWSLARKLSLDGADAEDAVQEAFVSLWESAHRFDPARGSEPLFVAMIVRRRLIDRIRARGRRPQTEEIDDNLPSDAPHPERAAEAALAARAVLQLRPEQQRVLVLTTRDGLTHEEIAERTGMPLGTVKAHARRALLKLRSVLFGSEAQGQDETGTTSNANENENDTESAEETT